MKKKMRMREERREYQYQYQYLGDISALCFLHLPSHLSPSSFPFLLAGTGSHLLLFDVTRRHQIQSFDIFEGLRVHLIASSLLSYVETNHPSSYSVTFRVAVSGERRVKLYILCLHFQSHFPDPPNVSAHFNLLHLLPTFSHWVLDLCFLQDDLYSSQGGRCHLALGCSGNSVHLWDISSSTLLCEVKCPERCLLYSMRMRGDKFGALHVASGTIFNEIVVWKLVRVSCATSLKSTAQGFDVINSLDSNHISDCYNYEADIVSRLAGHQGSIFCLSWSSDGSKLVSVSDDRSARMWIAETKMNSADNSSESLGMYLPGPILFGHNARVWDCCICDSLIVTVGEDCTCRVWGLDGKELTVIKEHMGRGIWRCLYDPYSSLLVTGGFDSAIKVRCLSASNESMKKVKERNEEVFTVSIPNLSGHNKQMDSKSEYVRCLKFAREDAIYVATNHGYVYYGELSDSGSLEWTELVRAAEEVPIICMDLLSIKLSELSPEVVDWVAVGDGKGVMKVIQVSFTNGTPQVAIEVSWSAEMERQLLGTYWCISLGSESFFPHLCEVFLVEFLTPMLLHSRHYVIEKSQLRFVFTSNPRGMVKLWRRFVSSTQNAMKNCDAYLVADFVSSFGARIMCLDASPQDEVLVCGDLRGNLVLFPLSKSSILVDASPDQCIHKISSPLHFKGAHGISAVSSISIATFSSSILAIHSTGADGCICYLEYNKDVQNLEFVGMKQIKELSLVQCVSNVNFPRTGSGKSSYAVGFSSTNFLIWNLTTETKLLQVKCGGWRRPHSYHLGCQPDISSSFAYVKDETIYIHRYRVPHGVRNSFPCNLHLQFHGREIHTLCIISEQSKYAANSECSLHLKSTWIATGCEDGTVRLTRFSTGDENWCTSNLLGEHVGGSAVRSLCFVSKVHSAESKGVDACNENKNPCLLISVGAKRVLTSWLLRKREISDRSASSDGLENKHSLLGDDSMPFKWLSTDMPVKRTHSPNQPQGYRGPMPTQACTKDHALVLDNDWRYLAVTAFLLSVAHPRSSVCFIVVACSDATLTLRAFVLPYRYWFDVACLAPLSSPVLTLQHVVVPLHFPSQGNTMTRNIYIVISGSTDGSIIFWDLSEHVEAFMRRVPCFLEKKSMDIEKRPRTGRGSQGGRWWRSIDASMTCKRVSTPSSALSDKSISDDHEISDGPPVANKVCPDHMQTTMVREQESLDGCEIKPWQTLSNVHQSGVNCLHVCSQDIRNDSPQYCVVSGGDDQALSLLRFVVLPGMQSNLKDMLVDSTSEHCMRCPSEESYSIRFLSQKKAISAHSCAVKGVWTDGVWVFSTGLDQRVRRWNIEKDGNITEFGHFITSVPEPEALDVTPRGSECYQVAVAGRGMQVVEFFSTL